MLSLLWLAAAWHVFSMMLVLFHWNDRRAARDDEVLKEDRKKKERYEEK